MFLFFACRVIFPFASAPTGNVCNSRQRTGGAGGHTVLRCGLVFLFLATMQSSSSSLFNILFWGWVGGGGGGGEGSSDFLRVFDSTIIRFCFGAHALVLPYCNYHGWLDSANVAAELVWLLWSFRGGLSNTERERMNCGVCTKVLVARTLSSFVLTQGGFVSSASVSCERLSGGGL